MSERNSSERLHLSRLNPQAALGYDFYMIPKLLINHEAFDNIDYGAKMLYSFMLNRASLSARNLDDFTDEQGQLYIIYTIEQVMENMRCSNKTAVKMVKQLEDIGLIDKKRQGQGKPSIIYVNDFSEVVFQKCNTYTSRSVKSTFLEVKKVHSSYNDYNKTYIKSINQSEIGGGTLQKIEKPKTKNQKPNEIKIEKTKKELIDRIDEPSYEDYENHVKKNIEYEHLKKHNKRFKNSNELNEIVMIMVDTLTSTKKTIRVGGEDKPANVVKNRLLKLDVSHIEYVFEQLSQNTNKIMNVRSYILTVLYNAPSSLENHYLQEVNFDFGRKW